MLTNLISRLRAPIPRPGYSEPLPPNPLMVAAADEIERLRQALSDLYDWQNGPPLSTDRWLTGWGNAMKAAERCLGYPTLPPEPEAPKW